MTILTCRREQALWLGGVIRLLLLHHDRERVRLAFEAPPGIDVVPDDTTVPPRRHDLICWHPDPAGLLRKICARFPEAVDDLHSTRTGVAWFGNDSCTLALLEAYVQGLCDASRNEVRRSDFLRNIPPLDETT